MRWQLWRLGGCLAFLSASMLGAAQERAIVTVWGTEYSGDSRGFEDAVKEFERLNPDLRVRVLSMGAGQNDPQKLMTAIVGHVAPDVVKQDRFTIADWASRGAFLDLKPSIERDRLVDPNCPVPEKFYPATWKEASFRGGVYAIPESADSRVLFWNKSVFRESATELRNAGLDPNRPPKTWDEVLAYSRVLTKFHPDGSLKRAGFIPLVGNAWLYLFAFQQNAPFLSSDGTTCVMASPEMEAALSFVVKGYDIVGGYEKAKAFETGFKNNADDPFILGKVAFKIDGDWFIPTLARYAPRLEFGTAPAPIPVDRLNRVGRFSNETEPFITWQGGYSWIVPKGARNPEGGWRFIKFMSSTRGLLVQERSNARWTRRSGREHIPRLKSNREATELIFEQYKPQSPQLREALSVARKMAEHGRFRPMTPVGQRLFDEQKKVVERASLGGVSPSEALHLSQGVIQRELDRIYTQPPGPKFDSRIPLLVTLGIAMGTVLGIALTYRKAHLRRHRKSEAIWGYVLILPWIIGFFVFSLGPMIASLALSFTNDSVLSQANWVGLQNYNEIVGADRDMIKKAYENALFLALIGIPLSTFTGLALALLLNSAVRGASKYRMLFYLPAIVPGTVAAALWSQVLSADPERGILNSFWQKTLGPWFNLPAPGWMSSEAWSKPGLILMGLWGAGGGIILWLAALKGVSKTYSEAATLDGAGPWKQFWAVTLPQLTPILYFNLVIGVISALQEFDRIYILKPDEGGTGINDSMLMPAYHLFRSGFGYFKMGYASALAWMIFLVVLVLTLMQLKARKRWVFEESES